VARHGPAYTPYPKGGIVLGRGAGHPLRQPTLNQRYAATVNKPD